MKLYKHYFKCDKCGEKYGRDTPRVYGGVCPKCDLRSSQAKGGMIQRIIKRNEDEKRNTNKKTE